MKTFFTLSCVCALAAAAYFAGSRASFARPLQTRVLVATIKNSGSTNTLPYSIELYDNGSATLDVKDRPQMEFPPRTVDSEKLKSLLQQVGDVSVLSGGRCARSVSFGTTTKITHNGKTSGDISCTANTAWPKAGYDLAAFINSLRQELKIEPALRRPQ